MPLSQLNDNQVIEVPYDLFQWYQSIVREKFNAQQLQLLEFADDDFGKGYIILLPFEYFYEPKKLEVNGWWGDKDFLKNNIKDFKVLTVSDV